MQSYQCHRINFNETRLVNTPKQSLKNSEIRLQIERFSFTANNITYAVLGDFLKYWSFFPAMNENGEDVSDEWGQIPVWGFATVTESNNNEVAIGERFFGYFPPAEECVMQPTNRTNNGFIDGSEHRVNLPQSYNVYRVAPKADEQSDNERSMLYPLFVTAYCIHDMLTERDWVNAEQVLIVSASSKTSIGVAYAIQNDATSPKSIGLTSARNVGTVEKLALYDAVNSYDHIKSIDPRLATVIIDMSGNKSLLSELHQHLGDAMKLTLNVGITHWGDLENTMAINTDRSEQFFAPDHIQSMMKRLGPQAFQAQSGAFITESAIKTRRWLNHKDLNGLEALAVSYNDVCSGLVDTATGLIVKMT